MAAWFNLTKNDKGQFSFSLKADDTHVLLRSETYESKASAQNGILAVQKNAATDARFELKNASDGRPYFNLKSANGQVVGTSPMFADAAARDAAVAAVKADGATADVREA